MGFGFGRTGGCRKAKRRTQDADWLLLTWIYRHQTKSALTELHLSTPTPRIPVGGLGIRLGNLVNVDSFV